MGTKSLFRIAALFALTLTVQACAGGSGSTASTSLLPQTAPQSPAPATPMQIISRGPNDALTIAGNVVAILSDGIQIEGGQGVGYFNVYTSSSTQIVGPKPYVGEFIEATGTGTTSMNATLVQQIFQVTGPIAGMKNGGFQIEGGPGIGYMDIWTNSSTLYSGAKPYVGEIVSVLGTGTMGVSLTAIYVTQVFAPTPSPSASSTPLPTVSGPIVAMINGGFQLHGPPGVGYIDIWTNSSTQYIGAKPYVGESVTVTGTGSLKTSLTAVTVTQTGGSSSPTPAATSTPAPTPTPGGSFTPPPATPFMPSSWGKISAFQVFDDTSNGYITQSAAQADGYRYAAVWGSRWNIGTSWNDSNSGLQTAYYNALETDESSTGWGAIGHSLSWWQTNHPDWILYACTSSGTPTTTPAWVPGLNNVPLDVHNPSVVAYQIGLMATYAHSIGYHALAIDEATFWQADEGVSGGYGCGVYENGTFVRRYTGPTDPNWATDVVAWVKQAHELLNTAPLSSFNLKLVVNHPADQLTANEEALLSNTDAVLDETGYSDYGNYRTGSASNFVMTTEWAKYAQEHGTAVLMNQNWGGVSVGTPQIDYSVATYLMGNEQAESLFAASATGYGLEQYHSQYATAIGAPCGEYYSAGDPSNPSIYYRRFTNAVVVVNGGSGSANEVAYLPGGHSYSDLFGRSVSSPLSIASNDGYVLLTSNGCH